MNWIVAGVMQFQGKKTLAGFRGMGVVRFHLGMVVSEGQERLGSERQGAK